MISSYWFVADFLTSFLGLTRQSIKIGTENFSSSSSSSSSSDLPLTQNHKWWDWKDIAMSSSLRTTKTCAQCLAAIRAPRPAEIATSIAGPSNYQEHMTEYSSFKRTSTSPSSLRGNSYKVRNLPKTKNCHLTGFQCPTRHDTIREIQKFHYTNFNSTSVSSSTSQDITSAPLLQSNATKQPAHSVARPSKYQAHVTEYNPSHQRNPRYTLEIEWLYQVCIPDILKKPFNMILLGSTWPSPPSVSA